MLYEAITYKDIDDFNGDASNRYDAEKAAETDYGPAWQWKIIHMSVNKNGTLFVLWCRGRHEA